MRKLINYIRNSGRNVMYQAFVPLAPVTQSSKLSNLYGSNDLATYVNRLFVFALTIGAIMAVVRLMWAGYLYMGSGDMWSNKGKAKEVIGDVVFGLLLLLAIYLILFQINPDLLNLNALQNIKSTSQQSGPAPSESGFFGNVPAGTSNVNGLPVDQNNTPL